MFCMITLGFRNQNDVRGGEIEEIAENAETGSVTDVLAKRAFNLAKRASLPRT
ncbi:hypothetical protein A2U01_0058386 [Trifolium medium]|uniref:Uncharacterized protein n=1 Tax=Trifolium medium TaxID=97028 RepID=A0A392RLT2_9FABA|nr:hypothetical protein [Trifolium medium]